MSQIRNSNFWDLLLWLLRRRKRFRVVGVSMLPLLVPGDEVLVDQLAYRYSHPCQEDLVVILSPQQPDIRLIKRIIAVRHNGTCFVQGDNLLQSTDSRVFGWVDPQLILGRVTSRFF